MKLEQQLRKLDYTSESNWKAFEAYPGYFLSFCFSLDFFCTVIGPMFYKTLFQSSSHSFIHIIILIYQINSERQKRKKN